MQYRPDILHCQGLNAAFFLWFYRWFARRVVVRYGSVDHVNAKWRLAGRLGFRWCEWQLRWADAVIAVTPSLRQRLLDLGMTSRVVVIPNAVDPIEAVDGAAVARFGLEPRSFVLGVGRLTAQKDFATLVRAFHAARALDPAIGKLVIVGGDDGSGYLKHLQELGGTDVVFTGRLPRAEVAGLMAACRLYVNSSRHEGLSNAILEAVSHGCPIVVSDIVENRDLPLASHQFFPVGDADALAAKLHEVRATPALYRTPADTFATWPDVVAATLRLYQMLLRTSRLDRRRRGEPLDEGAAAPPRTPL